MSSSWSWKSSSDNQVVRKTEDGIEPGEGALTSAIISINGDTTAAQTIAGDGVGINVIDTGGGGHIIQNTGIYEVVSTKDAILGTSDQVDIYMSTSLYASGAVDFGGQVISYQFFAGNQFNVQDVNFVTFADTYTMNVDSAGFQNVFRMTRTTLSGHTPNPLSAGDNFIYIGGGATPQWTSPPDFSVSANFVSGWLAGAGAKGEIFLSNVPQSVVAQAFDVILNVVEAGAALVDAFGTPKPNTKPVPDDGVIIISDQWDPFGKPKPTTQTINLPPPKDWKTTNVDNIPNPTITNNSSNSVGINPFSGTDPGINPMRLPPGASAKFAQFIPPTVLNIQNAGITGATMKYQPYGVHHHPPILTQSATDSAYASINPNSVLPLSHIIDYSIPIRSNTVAPLKYTGAVPFAAFGNSPTLILTPNYTGYYKVYACPTINAGTGSNRFTIENTVGNANIFCRNTGGIVPDSGLITFPQTVESWFNLEAGNVYHFDICGFSNGTRGITLQGQANDGTSASGAEFNIWAEQLTDAFYISPSLPGNSSNLTSTSYASFAGTGYPFTFTFTSLSTGIHRISASVRALMNAPEAAFLTITKTAGLISGVPTHRDSVTSSAGANLNNTFYVDAFFPLVQGTSYSFEIQGKVNTGSLALQPFTGTGGNDFMFAEEVPTLSTSPSFTADVTVTSATYASFSGVSWAFNPSFSGVHKVTALVPFENTGNASGNIGTVQLSVTSGALFDIVSSNEATISYRTTALPMKSSLLQMLVLMQAGATYNIIVQGVSKPAGSVTLKGTTIPYYFTAEQAFLSGVQSINGDFNPQQIINGINGIQAITTNGITTIGVNPPLPVTLGGTGQTSLVANKLVVGNGTGAVNQVATGTTGQVLTSNGPGVDPTFQTSSSSGGTVTSVNSTAPAFLTDTVTNPTTTPNIALTLSGVPLQITNTASTGTQEISLTNTNTDAGLETGFGAFADGGTSIEMVASSTTNANRGIIRTAANAGLDMNAQGSGKTIRLETNSVARATISDTGMTLSAALPVGSGGTGLTTLTNHGVVVGQAASAVHLVGPSATTGLPLLSQGSSSDPSFAALSLSTSTSVTGTLPVDRGGTGVATLASGNVLGGNGTSAMVAVHFAPDPAANTLVETDANSNIRANELLPGITVLTMNGIGQQWSYNYSDPYTGNIIFCLDPVSSPAPTTVTLPTAIVVFGLVSPFFIVLNKSTQILTVNTFTNILLTTVPPSASCIINWINLGSPSNNPSAWSVSNFLGSDTSGNSIAYGNLTSNGQLVSTTPISVSSGGTGVASLTAHDVLIGNGTSAVTLVTPSTAGFILTSNGTGADPSFQAVPAGGSVTSVALTAPSAFTVSGSPITTSGTLAITYSGTAIPVTSGGTGLTTVASGNVLGGNGTGNLALVPFSTTLTASTLAEWDSAKNLPVNNLFYVFSNISSNSQPSTTLTASSSHHQFFNGTVAEDVTLPTTCPIGTEYKIVNRTTQNLTVNTTTPIVLNPSEEVLVTALVANPGANQWTYARRSHDLVQLNAVQGGTGFNTYSLGDILLGTAGNILSKLAIGSTGNVLTVTGGTAVWAAPATDGTVTSVDMTVPSILSVSGNPITSSGTLALTYSGTALPVANGGTGVTTLTSGSLLVGAGTSAVTFQLFSNAIGNSTIAQRTSNGDLSSRKFIYGFSSNATSSITLSSASNGITNITNGGAVSVTLPASISSGTVFTLIPTASSIVTLFDNAATQLGIFYESNVPVTIIGTGSGSPGTWTTSQPVGVNNNGTSNLPNFISGVTSTVTAAGTTTLANTANRGQIFTGTTTQTVKLPTAISSTNANGGIVGTTYTIYNQSTGALTVQTNSAAALLTQPAGTVYEFTQISTANDNASSWVVTAESGVGVASINGDTTPAQLISGGTGITASTTSGTTTVSLSTPVSVTNGGTGAGTFTSGQLLVGAGTSAFTTQAFSSTAAAGVVTKWDANANLHANNYLYAFQTIATAAGTTAFTVSTKQYTQFTGSSTQIVTLPDTSTLVLGTSFWILNQSTGNVTVNTSTSVLVQVIVTNQTFVFTCISTAVNTAAAWAVNAQGQNQIAVGPGLTANQIANSSLSPPETVITNIPMNSNSIWISTIVNTDSSTITSNTLTAFSNSPALSFTAPITGTYRVYTTVPASIGSTNSGASCFVGIIGTSGSPANFGSNILSTSGLDGVAQNVSLYTETLYTLTAGVSYVFDVGGKYVSSSNSITAIGSTNPFYLFAEYLPGYFGTHNATTSTTSSTSYVAVTSSGITITPGFTGYYRINANVGGGNIGDTATTHLINCKVDVTSGSPVQSFISESVSLGSTGGSATYSNPMICTSLFQLIAGTTYVFDLYCKIASGGTTSVLGSTVFHSEYVPDFSSAVCTTTGTDRNATSFANLNASPTLSFTPTISGNYKFTCFPNIQNDSNSGGITARYKLNLNNTARVLATQTAFLESATSAGPIAISTPLFMVCGLIAGTTYTADIQGLVTTTGGTGVKLLGGSGQFYLTVEQVNVQLTGGGITSINGDTTKAQNIVSDNSALITSITAAGTTTIHPVFTSVIQSINADTTSAQTITGPDPRITVITSSGSTLVSPAFIPPAVTRYTSAGSFTYTTPTSPSPLYLTVELLGAGGGGGSSTNGSGGAGGAGGNSVFGSATAASGSGGGGGGQHGTPGSANTQAYTVVQDVPTTSTGPFTDTISNISGIGYPATGGHGVNSIYGNGGFGGSNGGVSPTSGGGANGTGFGSGGGGGASAFGSSQNAEGGAAGGYLKFNVSGGSLVSTFAVTVGAAGAAGTGGTFNGGSGTPGYCQVIAFYQ